VHGGERGRDAVRAEREEETLHAESEGRGNTGNTVSARPWEQRTSSLTKMSRKCRTSPFNGGSIMDADMVISVILFKKRSLI
jgi:hypothetical protein